MTPPTLSVPYRQSNWRHGRIRLKSTPYRCLHPIPTSATVIACVRWTTVLPCLKPFGKIKVPASGFVRITNFAYRKAMFLFLSIRLRLLRTFTRLPLNDYGWQDLMIIYRASFTAPKLQVYTIEFTVIKQDLRYTPVASVRNRASWFKNLLAQFTNLNRTRKRSITCRVCSARACKTHC